MKKLIGEAAFNNALNAVFVCALGYSVYRYIVVAQLARKAARSVMRSLSIEDIEFDPHSWYHCE